MKSLRFICAQPAVKYYTWQVEVMINNFIKHGINPNQMDVLCAINNDVIPDEWRKLADHYNYVRFFFYNDTRTDRSYIPSIYFNMMKQHIVARPEIQNDILFTHDSDTIFTKRPDFSSMCGDHDKAWYLSDTKFYINYDYIQQKSNDLYLKMCEIVGIDKLIPKLMNSNSGGAQYLVKDTTYEFWDKVEKDSIALYGYFNSVEHLYQLKHTGDYPIQKWTAGMWSYLWNAWYFGHETLVDKRMDFGWVTNHISDIEKYCILHNAGVTDDRRKELFYKGDYINELPYGKELNVSKDHASSYYWQEICETAKKSILL